ncbi:exported hypothetical protein [Pseudomonas sp. IT-93MI4]
MMVMATARPGMFCCCITGVTALFTSACSCSSPGVAAMQAVAPKNRPKALQEMNLLGVMKDMSEPLSMSVEGDIPLHCGRFCCWAADQRRQFRQSGTRRQTMIFRMSH